MPIEVDNSGAGDCMYFAYSISLMYYLRAKKDEQSTNTRSIVDLIFKKLSVNGDIERELLYYVLDTKGPFTRSDIKSIIEPILGPAARALATKQTHKEFLIAKADTKLAQAVGYGLEYYFQFFLKLKKNDAYKVIDNDFKHPAFASADIFRIPKIKDKLLHYIKQRSKALIAKFEQKWNAVKKNPDNLDFQKSQLIRDILKKESENFLTQNNEEALKAYLSYLGTKGTYGSVETLSALHEALRGETRKRGTNGRVETIVDIDFSFQVFKNEQAIISNEEIDIKLKNKNNRHWVSLVPEHLYYYGLAKLKNTSDVTPPDPVPGENIYDALDTTFSSIAPHAKSPSTNVQLDQSISLDSVISTEVQVEVKTTPDLNKAPSSAPQQPDATPNLAEFTAQVEKAPITSANPILPTDLAATKQSPVFTVDSLSNEKKQLLIEAFESKMKFNEQLSLLYRKSIDFQERVEVAYKKNDHKEVEKLKLALNATLTLNSYLEQESLKYFINPTKENYIRFIKNANAKIELAKDVLKHHRGNLQLLGNIGLAILGVGVLYLLAIGINRMVNNQFLFFNTKSANILKDISDIINDKDWPPRSLN